MCAFINEATHSNLAQSELMDIWRRAFALDLELFDIAKAVSAHTEVGILTNNPQLLRNAFPVWFPQIESLFDPIVFSFELRATKPDPRAFASAERRAACSGPELMLIDDSPANVEAATAFGWQAIHYTNASELKEKLAVIGVY